MDSDKTQDEFISQLYHDMFDFLSMYAMCRLIDPSSAEEAIQDTFLTAWVKKDDLASSPNPRGWLVNTLKKTFTIGIAVEQDGISVWFLSLLSMRMQQHRQMMRTSI